MTTVSSGFSRTLNGVTDFKISGFEYNWTASRNLSPIDIWQQGPNSGFTAKFTLAGNNWGVAGLMAGGDMNVTINDAATGSNRTLSAIHLWTAGTNKVTITKTNVQTLTGGEGRDEFTIGDIGVQYVATHDGNDLVDARAVGFLDLGAGNNVAKIGAGGAGTIWAGGGNDVISTTGEVEFIRAGRGDDRVTTGPEWVGTISAGRGKDVVILNRGGADEVSLGRDADRVIVKKLSDPTSAVTLRGGENVSSETDRDKDLADFSNFTAPLKINLTKTELVSTSQGSFVLMGFEDVNGGSGSDTLTGNLEANVLRGRGGDDTLNGLGGDDQLFGEAGDDRLIGLAGKDRLVGGGGNDRLDGGVANDVLIGGAGADQFVFKAGYGSDRITDFGNGNDKIVIGGSTVFADVTITDAGSNTLIEFANVDITLVNVDHATIDATDFVFA